MTAYRVPRTAVELTSVAYRPRCSVLRDSPRVSNLLRFVNPVCASAFQLIAQTDSHPEAQHPYPSGRASEPFALGWTRELDPNSVLKTKHRNEPLSGSRSSKLQYLSIAVAWVCAEGKASFRLSNAWTASLAARLPVPETVSYSPRVAHREALRNSQCLSCDNSLPSTC